MVSLTQKEQKRSKVLNEKPREEDQLSISRSTARRILPDAGIKSLGGAQRGVLLQLDARWHD
jgi:hypothetical protein